MTSQREFLAKYQARLLSMLHASENPGEACESMRQIATEAGMQSEVQDIDIRMIDVAMSLTRKWGVICPQPQSEQ